MSKKSSTIRETGAEANASGREVVEVKARGVARVGVRIVGISSLIQNNFSQKAMEQMLSKHVGRTVVKEKKNPRQVIEDAKIVNLRGEICIPPTGIKKAMLTASSLLKLPTGARKGQLRQSIFVDGQSIPIKFESMQPRLDMVRTSGMNRTPDVRFRPQFDNWSATFVLSYSVDIISLDLVLNLLERAGDGVGIGEWRPEKDGTNGRFKIDPELVQDPKAIGELKAACSSPLKPLIIPTWALDADIDPDLLRKIAGGDSNDETEESSEAAAE